MKPATTKLHHFFPILAILISFSSTFLPTSTAQTTPPPSSPVPGGCADSVISFSPCLPYISAPPNDLSDEPSSQCCEIFNAAFGSDDAECLCYLVRQDSLLGFPLNVTKLLSLSDLCGDRNSSQTNGTTNSLESICLGSPTLPPLMAVPKKPPSDVSARQRPRHAPPPPHHTLPHTPPFQIPKPTPASSAPTQNTTERSTSEHSNDPELTNAAYISWFLFEFLFEFVCFIINRI